MRFIFSVIFFLSSFSAFAVERSQLEELLNEKGSSLAALESQGMELIFGERTGGGKMVPFSHIEVLFTKDEAILKKEMVNIKLSNGSLLKNLQSIQANGRHIEANQIIGIITK